MFKGPMGVLGGLYDIVISQVPTSSWPLHGNRGRIGFLCKWMWLPMSLHLICIYIHTHTMCQYSVQPWQLSVVSPQVPKGTSQNARLICFGFCIFQMGFSLFFVSLKSFYPYFLFCSLWHHLLQDRYFRAGTYLLIGINQNRRIWFVSFFIILIWMIR